jgi:hypothetical protein
MLRSLSDLERYTVSATDGDVGTVVNFLFDDERWAIRYLVVETGAFLQERRVLISPISFRRIDLPAHRFHLALTMDKIARSPGVAEDEPVSRQREREYNRHYGYGNYWGGGVWGAGSTATLLESTGQSDALDPPVRGSENAHLQSAEDVRGYKIEGSDAAIGFVTDFLVDDETWEVRYLVVDTSHWRSGKTVLVAPSWATQISWDERKVFVTLSRDAIKDGPPWDGAAAVRREYEVRLHDHHGRPGYWADQDLPVGEPRLQHRFRSRSA